MYIKHQLTFFLYSNHYFLNFILILVKIILKIVKNFVILLKLYLLNFIIIV